MEIDKVKELLSHFFFMLHKISSSTSNDTVDFFINYCREIRIQYIKFRVTALRDNKISYPDYIDITDFCCIAIRFSLDKINEMTTAIKDMEQKLSLSELETEKEELRQTITDYHKLGRLLDELLNASIICLKDMILFFLEQHDRIGIPIKNYKKKERTFIYVIYIVRDHLKNNGEDSLFIDELNRLAKCRI